MRAVRCVRCVRVHDAPDVWSAPAFQVHRARVPSPTGTREEPLDVAVKLQYPNLREQVAADFEVLAMMQAMVSDNKYDFSWLLADLQKYVTSELDFRTEAANTRAAADALRNLAPGVVVPALVPQLCSGRTLATHFIDGLTRLDRPAELAARDLDPAHLGSLVSTAFAELALQHGLVHGDPHSGNVYACRRGGRSQVVLLDHGLYHRLADEDRLTMCALILDCATPCSRELRTCQLTR